MPARMRARRMSPPPNIYSPEFVSALFDEMSATYGVVNVISSFGFCVRWRRQCVERVSIAPGDTVCDLMAGMGELWPAVARQLDFTGCIRTVDISPVMCERSRSTAAQIRTPVDIRLGDALRSDLPDSAADVVLSCFGLKTFSRPQLYELALQLERILKPGGCFSCLEISVPSSALLRIPYLFYLTSVIPLIGWAFLGNPDNYRWLGVYTKAFVNCDVFVDACRAAGLVAERQSFFFGCATAVVGRKKQQEADLW